MFFLWGFAIYFLQTSKMVYIADEHKQTTKSGADLWGISKFWRRSGRGGQ